MRLLQNSRLCFAAIAVLLLVDSSVAIADAPLKGTKPAQWRVVYIGEGGMGVPQRTPKPERWFLHSPGMADQGHHVFVLTFGVETLKGKCVLAGARCVTSSLEAFVLNRSRDNTDWNTKQRRLEQIVHERTKSPANLDATQSRVRLHHVIMTRRGREL